VNVGSGTGAVATGGGGTTRGAVVRVTPGVVTTGAGVVAPGAGVVTAGGAGVVARATGAVGLGDVVLAVDVPLHAVIATPNIAAPTRNFLTSLLPFTGSCPQVSAR
jgi:hypothetical protein